MAVWMHRISHCAELSYKLLAQGCLSIGFSELAREKDFVSAMKDAALIGKNQRNFLEEKMFSLWGEKIKQSDVLRRFLLEFQMGDMVVVPLFDKRFTIVKITGQWLTLQQYEKQCHFNFFQNEADIGFLFPVSFLLKGKRDTYGIVSVSREGYADDALCSYMKLAETNADISFMQKNVEEAIAKQNNTHFALPKMQEAWAEAFLKIIQDFLQEKHIENLIKRYLQKQGAGCVKIITKAQQQYTEMVAEFEQLGLILFVNVEQNVSQIDQWALEQIQAYQKQLSHQRDGYIYGMWLISLKSSYSNALKEYAAKQNVQLIEGIAFSKMLLKAGLTALEEMV